MENYVAHNANYLLYRRMKAQNFPSDGFKVGQIVRELIVGGISNESWQFGAQPVLLLRVQRKLNESPLLFLNLVFLARKIKRSSDRQSYWNKRVKVFSVRVVYRHWLLTGCGFITRKKQNSHLKKIVRMDLSVERKVKLTCANTSSGLRFSSESAFSAFTTHTHTSG